MGNTPEDYNATQRTRWRVFFGISIVLGITIVLCTALFLDYSNPEAVLAVKEARAETKFLKERVEKVEKYLQSIQVVIYNEREFKKETP